MPLAVLHPLALLARGHERHVLRLSSLRVRLAGALPEAHQVVPVTGETVGQCLDVLAWISLAAALFTDFGQIPRRHRNFVRLLFLDSEVRGRYVDWQSIARTCVAFFRMAVVERPASAWPSWNAPLILG